MRLPLALVALALAGPAAAQQSQTLSLSATGTVQQVVDSFAQVCLRSPGDLAAQRAAVSASPLGFRKQKDVTPETWVSWPVQVTLAQEDEFVQCFVAVPVPAGTTLEGALAAVKPLAAPGARMVRSGDYVTWEQDVNGPQQIRLNLAAVPGGQVITLSISARAAR